MLKGPVLVATDLGGGGDEALRQADALARDLGGLLYACHILPEVLRVRMLFPQMQQQDASEMQALERKAGEAVAARIQAITGRSSEEYAVSTDTGSAHSGILSQAERLRPGVLVLGAGHSATRVVRHAPCPVLVARPSPAGKVLGATDFSDPARPAIDAALGEAKRRRVMPCLIHCIDLTFIEAGPMPAGYPVPPVPDAVLQELKASARRQLQVGLEGSGTRGEYLVQDGPVAQAIIRAAHELPAELVVVGTRGRTGLARLALGSVAEMVLADAPCSVLVVRLHEA